MSMSYSNRDKKPFYFFYLQILSVLSNYSNDTHKEVFTQIYHEAIWAQNPAGEGSSGNGSKFENAKTYVTFLQNFLIENNIKTVVDAGCGDWELSKHINWQGINYIGYDIVDFIIEKDIQKYASPNIRFICSNFLSIELPKADLLICKHVLQHLSNKDIFSFLKQISKFKYCLITNQVDANTETSENIDIIQGNCRPLDLSRPPFSLKGKTVCSFYYFLSSNKSLHKTFLICN